MKILFVHNTYQYYGGEDAVLEAEATILQQKGHEVRVLRFDNNSIEGVTSKLKAGSAAFYNFRSAKLVGKAIKEFDPDIVHVHNLFFTASPSVLFKAKQLGVPVVMTIHNYRLVCANALLLRNNKPCELCVNKTIPLDGIRYKCYRSSYVESALVTGITSLHKIMATWNSKVTRYIVLAEFAREKLANSSLKLPAGKIAVKPNFIFATTHIPTKRENFFLFVGRLSNEKGLEVLLRCFELNTEFKLVIVGDGPERENIIERIKNSSNIQYIGQQSKESVLEFMQKSRALIFPSIWYEGLPTTIIEAFSTGTPVVASRLGAMVEMIRENYNGFHFEPGNVDELKEKLSAVFRAGDELYQQARDTYERKYHPEIHYKEIMSIYQTAIGVFKNVG